MAYDLITWPDGNQLGVIGDGYVLTEAEAGYPILVLGSGPEDDDPGGLSFLELEDVPTTLAGYGITDAASDIELAAHAADTTGIHGIADTSDLATASGLAGAAYTIDALGISWGATNSMVYSDGGSGTAYVALGAANTVLKSTGIAGVPAFSKIVNADVDAAAAIATSKISGLAAVATSGSASDLSTGTLAYARLPSAGGTWNAGGGTVALTGMLTATNNQNGSTLLDVVNTTDGTSSLSGFRLQSDNNAAGSSRRMKFQVYAESHSTSAFAGRAVLSTDNVPIVLFSPSAGTTTGLDEAVQFTFGTTDYVLFLIRKETTNRRIASFFSNAPTDTGGNGVIFVGDRTAAPSSNPSGGFVMSSNSGVPTFRTSGGKIINLDQAAAYTQTYSTADRTHAARTAATLTDSVGGTVVTTIAAIPDPADTPATADALRDDLVANVLPKIRSAISSLIDQVNKGQVDALDSTQFLNAVADDMQARAFAG